MLLMLERIITTIFIINNMFLLLFGYYFIGFIAIILIDVIMILI